MRLMVDTDIYNPPLDTRGEINMSDIDPKDVKIKYLEQSVESLKKENLDLMESLEVWGRHDSDCLKVQRYENCTCGWSEELVALKQKMEALRKVSTEQVENNYE